MLFLCHKASTPQTCADRLDLGALERLVLAVTFQGNAKIVLQANDVIYIPAIDALLSPALAVIPMQLLAYYVAKENGCDIDKPKNLAKSVTVE